MPTAATPQEESQRRTRRAHRIQVAAALLFVFAVFSPTLTFDFVNRDDGDHLLNNRLVTGAVENPWWDYFSTPMIGYPIPVPVLTYRIEHALFGFNPAIYHFTNLVIHCLVALCVYLVARRLGVGQLGALIALLFFGVHPLVSEGFCWVANRKTPLSILFCLLAMITATPTEGAPLRKLRIWALELLALLSKTTSLFIGPVLLILDGLLNGRRVWRRLPFYGLLAATALLVMFVSMVKAGQVDAYSAPLPMAQRLRESWYALGYHLGLISFLHTPSPIHIPTHRPPLFAPMVDLLPLAYLAIGSLLYWRFRALRLLMLVSWAWVLFSALPGLNLIPLRRYLGDTYAYAPLIGVSWILGACLERIVRTQPGRKRRLAMGGAAAGVLLTMSLGSLNASAAWRDGVHLWRYVEELYPGSPQVCHAVGKAQIKQKRPGPALSQLIRCSRKWPDVSFAKHIGMALLELNRVDEAEQVFLRLVQEGKGDAHVRANLESIRAFKAQQR